MDYDSVYGLFGNLNSDPSDDFTVTKKGKVVNMYDYMQAYK